MASMFDTIADMLRGSAPDDLAHALGTDRTQTRRAMEIGLPALITGLRDKTLEPGGALNLAAMLDEPMAAVPADLDNYLADGDPSQGAAILDMAFGDRGEPALASLSSASGLSTRLLAQVMSVLAPLATGVVGTAADKTPDGLRSYLASAVEDLQAKGFGRVVELVSPAIVGIEDAPADDELAIVGDDTGTVVEGAFPGSVETDDMDDEVDAPDAPDLDPIVSGGGLSSSALTNDELPGLSSDALLDDNTGLGVSAGVPDALDDPTEAVDFSASMPSFDAEVANVAPAEVAIAGEADYSGPTVAVADDPLPGDLIDATELEGKGLSSMGWLWWLVGAVLGVVILLLVLSQCGGDDTADGVAAGEDTTVPTTVPTVDPLVAQQQQALDGVLAAYPGVTGEVVGGVAVLNGAVGSDTDKALLDQAVRGVIPSVQNNVSVSAAAAPAPEGYTINDIIDAQAELTTLRALLDQAGLGEALDGNGPFTLFAPTNEAFASISEQLAELQNDPTQLQNLLRYHLLAGSADSAALAGQTSVMSQLEDQSIELGVVDSDLILNGTTRVVFADANGRNGYLHVIDSVLFPQVAVELPEEIGTALGLAPITFDLGSSDLTSAGQAELDKVVAFLLDNPASIEIGGHTDADGEASFNQQLSQERADAVKAYMASQGVPADSMVAVGYGEDQPIAPNDTSENKAQNRRIEFKPN